MNHKLRIQIPRKNQALSAVCLIMLISLFSGFLTGILSIPSAVKYIIDGLNLLLLVLMVMNLTARRTALPKDARVLLLWVALFFAFAAVVYVMNYQSALYFLWGARNNFRFYVFFLACVLFLSRQEIDAYLRFFDRLSYVNVVFCFVEFFVFGLRQDYLGGIFGIEKGCNAHLNNFMVIVFTKSMIFYIHKKESLRELLLKTSLSMIIAAMAELKFFYVEAAAIILGSILLTRMSGRKLMLLLSGSAAVAGGLELLVRIFPFYKGLLSISGLLKMASEGGYSSAQSLNRLNAIPIISETILKEPLERLLGLGLGNCDTSAFSFLSTPFYNRYASLRYHWFSTSFLFLETGYVGLAFFFGFFVLVAWKGYKLSKQNADYEVYGQMAAIAAVMCILIGIYNSSLRTEAAYPIYFILAIPFVLQREKGRGRR